MKVKTQVDLLAMLNDLYDTLRETVAGHRKEIEELDAAYFAFKRLILRMER